MVKQKTIEDPNKEIWLLRVPSSISLDAVNNLPIAKERGAVGDIVARAPGAAWDHGGPVGRAFGGDVVIREESALADDVRPLVKTRSGSLRCAGVPVSRQLSLAVEHDPATTEMDAGKYVPSIVAPAIESVWSKDPIGEELLGKDFAEKTGYVHPIWSRSAYLRGNQPVRRVHRHRHAIERTRRKILISTQVPTTASSSRGTCGRASFRTPHASRATGRRRRAS